MANKVTKPITIASVVDVVGALATKSLNGQSYFMDTNKFNGSTDNGTENLKTAVKCGDELVWTVHFLECEAFLAIDGIVIDPNYCVPEEKYYEGTDITYWVGTVKKDVTHLPYSIRFKLGSRAEPMQTTSALALIG